MRGKLARSIRKMLESKGVNPGKTGEYHRIAKAKKKFTLPIPGAPLNSDGTLPTHEVEITMFQIIGPQGRRLCRHVKKQIARR